MGQGAYDHQPDGATFADDAAGFLHSLARNPASAELVDRPTVRYIGEFVTFDSDEIAALARHAGTDQDARPLSRRRVHRAAPGRTARAPLA